MSTPPKSPTGVRALAAVGGVFGKEGHGFDSQENEEKSWTAVAGFLQKHLGATDAPAKAAAAP